MTNKLYDDYNCLQVKQQVGFELKDNKTIFTYDIFCEANKHYPYKNNKRFPFGKRLLLRPDL